VHHQVVERSSHGRPGATLRGRQLADAQSEMRSLRSVIDDLLMRELSANRVVTGKDESVSEPALTENHEEF